MKYKQISFIVLTLSIVMTAVVMISCEKLDLKKFIALRTLPPDDIEDHSVKAVGKIIDFGGESIVNHGFVYAKHSIPTQADSVVNLGTPSSLGEFSTNIIDLDAASKYYLRAFVSDGPSFWYGDEVLFSTSGIVNLPDVRTIPPSEITATSAKSGGNVIADGGAPVRVRGICYGSASNPDTSGTCTSNGEGLGEFVSDITGLTSGTTCYIRAYAINSKGIAYGNQISFVAGQVVNVPAVITSNISGITSINATTGGEVISDGGAAVSDRGVCWSVSPVPTIADNHTVDGSGIGTFSSIITNLTPGTSYYVRAYATNSIGTAYGESKSFTTGGTSPNGEWLKYDNGTNYDGIGLNDGGSFDVAIRFEPAQLQEYDGWSIIRMRFYPKGATTTYAIEGFTGSNPDPDSPVFFQNVISPVIDSWNEIILDTPFKISADTDLWVGYFCIQQPAGEFPAGVDPGPATPFYSDLIFAGGTWNSMASFGLNLNWNIQVFVENNQGESKMLSVPVNFKKDAEISNNPSVNQIIKSSDNQ